MEQLFTNVLDVFGKPSKQFFAHLAHFAATPEEQAGILKLATADTNEHRSFVLHSKTLADVFMMFPSVRPSLPYLLDMIPTIKPRAYSIVSSPKVNANQLHLCILIDEWSTPEPEEMKR